MIRAFTLMTALSLLLGGLHVALAEPADAHKKWKGWRWKRCMFQALQPGTWTRREVKLTIRCAVRHWSVPGGARKALSVARCESGFRHDAYAAGNAGVFRQRLRYWPERSRRWGAIHGERLPRSAFNARANVVVSVRMASTGGWAAWACA